jgi:hypothetical protein
LTSTTNPKDIGRFLRTLRVATQTALALDYLTQGHGQSRSTTTFSALAAESAEGWRFPNEGLMSADGLLLARVGADALNLQAQGAAGLSTYAGRRVRVRHASGRQAEGVFDHDGRLEIIPESAAVSEADLAEFEVEILDTDS